MSGIYLNLMVAMIKKMIAKIDLKIEKLPFWAKFKAFLDRFLGIRYQHKRIQKHLLIYCVP